MRNKKFDKLKKSDIQSFRNGKDFVLIDIKHHLVIVFCNNNKQAKLKTKDLIKSSYFNSLSKFMISKFKF